MKNVKKVSKVLCAFGVSTVLLAGVVGAASNHGYNLSLIHILCRRYI